MVSGVLSSDVGRIWKNISPLVEKALEYGRGEYLPEDVLEFCTSGSWQMWVAHDDSGIAAFCTTEITKFPRKKVLLLTLSAGRDFALWKHGKEILKAFASEKGCDALRGGGRRGWARALGMKPIYEICEENIGGRYA